jgi:LysM repeat protein
MRTARQIATGLLIALVSIGIILGGLSLSLVEGGLTGHAPASPTLLPTNWIPFTPFPPTNTPESIATELSLTPTLTFTPPPTPANCPPPTNWLPYLVQPGDTLTLLAFKYNTTVDAVIQANCLLSNTLLPGSILYLPPAPTATPIPCGAPHGWVLYTVQPGDTLYHISQLYTITVADLQIANCLGNNTIIHTGQKLYVPPWAPKTATPTSTGPVTDSPTPTATFTETPTPVSTDTPTNSPAPSDTPTTAPTNTSTPVPSDTSIPPTATTP